MSTFRMRKPVTRVAAGSLASLLALLGGCGDDDAAPAGSGIVEVRLEAEETIPQGVSPGTGDENIVDGWQVDYTKYIVAIGRVELARATTPDPHFRSEDEFVVDMTSLPPTGFPLARFEGVAAERWDEFSYEVVAASASSTKDAGVSQPDFDEMVAGGLTYLIEGTLTKSDGESCVPGGACRPATSIAFRLGVPVPTVFSDCEAEEGAPGVSVAANTTTSVNATIHGDHLFFSAFPTGEEALARRAQWLANADTDGDDTVTRAELEGASAAGLFPTPDYSLTGAPMPIDDGWDFVLAQLKTQGHFQGEGECLSDGMGHERP